MPRPVPRPTAGTRPFWTWLAQGELRLPRCPECGRMQYPPLPRCPACLRADLDWIRLSGRGRLAAWAVARTDLNRWRPPPYIVAEVELEEQPGLIIAALLDAPADSPLHPGQPVECSFARDPGQDGAVYPDFRLAGPAQDQTASPGE